MRIVCFSHSWMVNHQKIVVAGKGNQAGVAKIMQAAFLPSNLNIRVKFFKALSRRNQGRKRTAMVPGNATEYGSRTHLGVSCKGRIAMFSPVCADRQADSISSIAASPNLPGDRLASGLWAHSTRFRAGALCG